MPGGIEVMDYIERAILRIKQAYEIAEHHNNTLICCDSGGKDSSVLIDLCIKAGVPFRIEHNHTTVDAPETVYFIRDNHERIKAQGISVKINYPDTTMWNLIAKKTIPPMRHIRYCCEHLKERKFDNQHLLLGVRWAESNRRKSRGLHEKIGNTKANRIIYQDENDSRHKLLEICVSKNRVITNPIIDWSNREIWGYIKKNNISVNPLYECGYHRVGCVGCPMSTKARYEIERHPKIKAAYIRAFDKMIEMRKKRGLQCDKSFEDGESIMRWWTDPKYDPKIEARLLTLENEI